MCRVNGIGLTIFKGILHFTLNGGKGCYMAPLPLFKNRIEYLPSVAIGFFCKKSLEENAVFFTRHRFIQIHLQKAQAEACVFLCTH